MVHKECGFDLCRNNLRALSWGLVYKSFKIREDYRMRVDSYWIVVITAVFI